MVAGALLSSFTFAAPATDGAQPAAQTNALDAAKAAGIDPYAAIPTDYTKYENGAYHFEEGSKASKWAKAQLELPSAPEGLEKRQAGNIGIGMWAQDWCTGAGVWADNVYYNVNNYGTTNFFSVGISYRGIRSNEKLDFSKLAGGDWCGQYAYSAARNTPTGCFNSQLINCFNLHF